MSDAPPGSSSGQAASSVPYRIIRAMFVVLFFWLFWKFGGYVITVLVIRQFGSGVASDAYFFATQAVVYGLIFTPALAVLIPAFMPVFVAERARRGEEAAWRFAGTVVTIVLLGCAVMLVAVYVGAVPMTDTLVGGFGPESRALGVKLLRWLLPGVVLMMIFLLLRAILNSYKVFGYPSAAEAVQKLLWVGVFAATAWLLDIRAVVVGFLAGSAAMVIVAAMGLRRKVTLFRPGLGAMSPSRFGQELAVAAAFVVGTGAVLYAVYNYLPAKLVRYRDLSVMTVVLVGVLLYSMQLWLRSRGRKGAMARFAVLAVPLVISTFFASYRNVVTLYFQSFTARGIFTDIEGARRIANFPVEVVALALSVAMLPYLCELASKTDHALLGDIVTKAIRMLAIAFVPMTVMVLVLADPISRLVLDRGDRPLLDLQFTAWGLQFFAIALVVYAAERVLMQAYFSLQMMWTPALLGMGATLFQVAFLAVPVYWLGLDYPVHLFVLVALAYPASRIVKNLFLLLILKRHVPVLPGRQTLVFAGKLAVLSAAVGAATFFALRWTKQAVPYEQYRQHKVVVDSFETHPDTWFAVNADEVGIQAAPADPARGAAVAMTYKRHGASKVNLTRRLDGVRTSQVRRLSFAAYSERRLGGLGVGVECRDGEALTLKAEQSDGPPAGGGAAHWCTYSVPLPERETVSLSWFEDGPAEADSNTLFLDDVRLTGADGRSLFVEDFDGNGWSATAGTAWVATSSGQRQYAGYALCLPADAQAALKSLEGYDLAGTDRVRCRLLNDSDVPASLELALESPGRTFASSVVLQPGKWQRLEVSRQELGCDAATWRSISAVRVRAGEPHGRLYLDELTFRTPPRGYRYLLAMGLLCALPSLAGVLIMLICLAALRFEELTYVIEWVKARGWRQRRADREGLADEQA
jgi:putative peptidoglycan lipid II flippase